jgi:hypothetical protein
MPEYFWAGIAGLLCWAFAVCIHIDWRGLMRRRRQRKAWSKSKKPRK